MKEILIYPFAVARMAFPELSFREKNASSSSSERTATATLPPPLTTPLDEMEYIQPAIPSSSSSSSCPSCLPPLPAIILCPQCPPATEWKKRPLFEAVMALLDMILLMHCPVDPHVETETPAPNPFLQHYNIDSSRVYLTGMSMGGLGSWMFAARYPGKQNDWHGCIIIHTIPYSE